MNEKKSPLQEKVSREVILYADNLMKDDEKAEFEKELKHSTGLQDELNMYLALLSEIDKVKNIPADEDYYSTMIPKFRLNQQKSIEQKLIPKFAFGAALMAAAVLFLFVLNVDENINQVNQSADITYTQAEIDSLLVFYPQYPVELDSAVANSEEYNALVDEILLSELSLSEKTLDSITTPTSYSAYLNLFAEVSDDEAELIYNEIINKSLF